MDRLSKGDQEVLSLMSKGTSDFDICRQLALTPERYASALDRIKKRAEQESHDAGRYYEKALKLRAEATLTSLQARFKALFDTIPQAVLVIDGRSGQIKQCNAVAEQLLGYQPGELVGRSVEDLVPERYRAIHPAYRLGFLNSVRKREMGYHPPIFGLRKDGAEVEMSIALTATPADDDVMVVCSLVDSWKTPEVKSRLG